MVASFAKKYLGCDKEYVRPDGLLLGYPVITAGENSHRGSFVKLLGENYDKYIDDIVDCAQRYGINLEKTKKKYPVEKAKGVSTKYNKL